MQQTGGGPGSKILKKVLSDQSAHVNFLSDELYTQIDESDETCSSAQTDDDDEDQFLLGDKENKDSPSDFETADEYATSVINKKCSTLTRHSPKSIFFHRSSLF